LIGLGKRRHELMLFAGTGNNHRAVLADYNLTLIDWLIASVTTGAIIAYSLYTFNAPNLPQNHLMMATIPFVIYGIFRYLYLIHVEGAGGAPERLVFRDRPLLLSIILWVVAAAAVMYLG
ncbi:MAG: decaprenyl-phosphate phosphoribosyltransferase, partial [Anaerolineales bacterium]|nr:decaprenyl-phosphate phosphoribosyltransferase [Anaerolineales bacterium]